MKTGGGGEEESDGRERERGGEGKKWSTRFRLHCTIKHHESPPLTKRYVVFIL